MPTLKSNTFPASAREQITEIFFFSVPTPQPPRGYGSAKSIFPYPTPSIHAGKDHRDLFFFRTHSPASTRERNWQICFFCAHLPASTRGRIRQVSQTAPHSIGAKPNQWICFFVMWVELANAEFALDLITPGLGKRVAACHVGSFDSMVALSCSRQKHISPAPPRPLRPPRTSFHCCLRS